MSEIAEGLNIVYEEPRFVVVNKPSGLLSVPGRTPDLQDCIVNRLKALYPDCLEQPSVHRLDMDTSGVLVLALDKETHRNLSIQFQNREVSKQYIALVDGIVTKASGTIELPFRLDPENRPYQVYDEVHGKMGLSHWEKLREENGCTRILFTPITGRTHQLRLHAMHEKGLGFPIVGDRLYGTGTAPGQLKLHASFLSFSHPQTGETLSFKSQPLF